MTRQRPVDRSDERDQRFFAALALGLAVTDSAKAAGYSRSAVYVWRNADETFQAQWEASYEAGTDALEDEARRRAVDGTVEPLFYKGEQVTEEAIGADGKPYRVASGVRKYSDLLLIFLLKARRPDKYRERSEIRHSGEVRLTHEQALDQLDGPPPPADGERDRTPGVGTPPATQG